MGNRILILQSLLLWAIIAGAPGGASSKTPMPLTVLDNSPPEFSSPPESPSSPSSPESSPTIPSPSPTSPRPRPKPSPSPRPQPKPSPSPSPRPTPSPSPQSPKPVASSPRTIVDSPPPPVQTASPMSPMQLLRSLCTNITTDLGARHVGLVTAFRTLEAHNVTLLPNFAPDFVLLGPSDVAFNALLSATGMNLTNWTSNLQFVKDVVLYHVASYPGNTSLALRNLAGVDIRLISVEDNSYITVRDALNQGTALVQGEVNSANITNMTLCTSKSKETKTLWSLDSILVPKAYESYYNASTLAHGTRANSQVPSNTGNITPLVTGVTPVNSALHPHLPSNITLLLLLFVSLLL